MKQPRYLARCLFALLCIALHGLSSIKADSDVDSALPTSLTLPVGESRVLAAQTQRIVVSSGSIVSVSPVSAQHIVLIAEQVGETLVHLWLRDGSLHSMRVTASSKKLDQILLEVQSLLQGVERVSARQVGQRVVLEGSAVDTASRERAAAVAALYPQHVVDMVGRLGWEDMVHVDVRIVEFRHGALQELGIRWRDEANGPSAGVIADWATNDRFRSLPDSPIDPHVFDPVPGRTSMRGYLGIASVLDSRIRVLEQSGDATIVAAPRLSCRSGGAARFVAGGEIPVPVINGVGSTDVEYREYGVILDVKPIADPSGSIFVKVETELSQVDEAQRVAGVPGLLKRHSSTDLNVRNGDTVVIAGLVSERRSADRNGLPGVSRLPGFGRLFGVKGKRHEQTELVIFLTPRIESAATQLEDDGLIDAVISRANAVLDKEPAKVPKVATEEMPRKRWRKER